LNKIVGAIALVMMSIIVVMMFLLREDKDQGFTSWAGTSIINIVGCLKEKTSSITSECEH